MAIAQSVVGCEAGPIFSRAAELLSSSDGYRDTLELTLAACLPALGDFGFFDARDGGEVVRIARAHEDEALEALLRPTRWSPQPRDGVNLCALTTGRPALHPDVDDAWYRDVAVNEQHLETLRRLAFRSMISVPMRFRGELIGALTLFMGRSGRRHDEQLLAIASGLAGIAAPVVANAALIERHERAEAALLASEAQLRLSYEAAGLGAWSWRVEDGEVYWSPEYREIYGLDAHEPPTFERGMAVVMPEDRDGVAAAVRRCIETGSEYRSEHRVLHPRKGLRWIQALGRPELGAGNRPVRLSGMVMDVTHRHEPDRARAYMAAIVESSEDAVISKTLDGVITSWNPAASRLYGYRAAEIVGKPITTLIPPELHEEELQILARVRSGQRVDHFETVRVAKDGRRIPVSLMVSPVRDAGGRIIGISKIARDLSAVQKANRELQALRDQLAGELEAMRHLQQISSRLISRDDKLEDLLLEILDAGLRITGRTRGVVQLHEPATGTLRMVAARGFDAAFCEGFREVHASEGLPSAAAMRTGERVIVEDIAADVALRSSPRGRALLAAGVRAVQCTPLRSRDGRLIGTFVTHSPWPSRPGERELRLLDILSRTAADLIERATAQAALKDADRRKDEFLAILAHELRNPLAPVRYAVSIARDPASTDEARRRAQAVIERQVSHMARLLDDLLDISRIARGTVSLRKERMELGACIAAAIEAARPLIDPKGHRLSTRLPADPLVLDADPVRVTQVLTNLVTNAAKYTDPGGSIEVEARREGSEAVIVVRDTGIGIPAELRPRLFTLFSQAGSALERSEGGLGIGLALVRGFVDLHGGSVEAHSEGPGRGSRFVVRLPIGEAARPPAGEPGVAPGAGRTSLRVLVADDNEDICEMCATLLGTWGHRCLAARDGDAALALIERERPDVALLDIGLPGVNGYQIGERVRASPWGRRIVLVAVTGWGQDEARARSSAAGFDFHLTKPVAAAEIERV
ncbi:MAG TPA: PAS domain S-box protein, partial [Usitatibacter sp.]|nr:PAS domain S-box protein [Usitatibacter sp.]